MSGDLSSDLGSVICFVFINIPLPFPGCLQSPPTVSEEKKTIVGSQEQEVQGCWFQV